MKSRLIVLFDGTWDTRADATNVWLLKELVAPVDLCGNPQQVFYDAGVGTHWYDFISGGAFGRGLSLNIRQGYRWIAERYAGVEDEIFIFGFSRGAYTARSLAGMIRKCGLLSKPSDEMVHAAYSLYRRLEVAPESLEATDFRKRFSREVRIRFIGVWDTVGALGIPLSGMPFGRDQYRWHDTELSKIVDYAYHAIAADEHRKDYSVAVWSRSKPENLDVEQRWFVGSHENVGGGIRGDRLSSITLRWICDRAEERGLKLIGQVPVGSDDHLSEVRDSFSKFMFHLYGLFRKRYHRPFGEGAGETVDKTVWLRWEADPGYRPPSLIKERARMERDEIERLKD